MFSATDVANFLACHQLLSLDRAHALGEIERPYFPDPGIELLRELGAKHEQSYLRHQYQTAANRSPYAEWFNRLDAAAAAKIVPALTRLEAGNTSNVKAVGEGVSELKVDFGPGYRVYFGWDGTQLVLPHNSV
jgi:putative addiction module killer protein